MSTAADPLITDFPRALSAYADPASGGVVDVVLGRLQAEPFNGVATAIFLLAILHTFRKHHLVLPNL